MTKSKKHEKETNDSPSLADIERNIELFKLNTGQKYNGAEEYAQQFKRCSVLQDTEIVYSQSSVMYEVK